MPGRQRPERVQVQDDLNGRPIHPVREGGGVPHLRQPLPGRQHGAGKVEDVGAPSDNAKSAGRGMAQRTGRPTEKVNGPRQAVVLGVFADPATDAGRAVIITHGGYGNDI